MRIYILNEHNQLSPIGVRGELFLGGIQLARGYWNKEDLTAARFVNDPFCEGERLYRTGDVGRWLQDGTIEYLGRSDDQLKIRGYRIEPSEIEYAILRTGLVQETKVFAIEPVHGNKELAACVTGNMSLSIPELKAMLYRSLPAYMVPLHYVFLDKMPLTGNGKIDMASIRDGLAGNGPGTVPTAVISQV